ncbi:MAG: nicotinate-nucleotide--dimethylbenzimidazole phosphoribosyltransferase [Ruminococcus sp.]|nr:nicotinate-nucleotide--dimethylbenzimidazole phosphoribosyltransferase [Ruminococcus sp.]
MERIKLINPTDKKFAVISREKWNSVAKPLGSFGELEKMIEKISAVQESENVDISKRTAVIMCADNGVAAEKISQSGQEVTALCAAAIAGGRSNINALARQFNADVAVVDIGIKNEVSCKNLVMKNIMHGTENILHGAAMSENQAKNAVSVGIDMVKQLKENGKNIIITGEMGIGNTTAAAAVSSVILGVDAETVTGRGAGLTDDGLKRKIEVVNAAVRKNSPDRSSPIDILAKVGGLDIAGMTGLFLGGAIYHVPIVIDGVISAVSAALAFMLSPACADYMLPSHVSEEPAGKMLLDFMGLKAVINAGLRLGEGTGGMLLLPLLDGAVSIYNNSHSFEELGIERYKKLS